MTAAATRPEVSADVRRLRGEPACILALAAGATATDAAEAAGINERTVRRRLDDEEYRAALAEIRDAALDRAVGTLTDGSIVAARTLLEIASAPSATWELLEDGGERRAGVWRRVGIDPSTKVAAARAVLEHAVALADHAAVLERLEELEEQIDTLTRQRGPRAARPDHPWKMNAS